MLATWQATVARRKEYVAAKLEYELEQVNAQEAKNDSETYRKYRKEAACSASEVQWIHLKCALIAEWSSRASNAVADKLDDSLRKAKAKAKTDRTTVKEHERHIHQLYSLNPILAPPKLPKDMRSKSLSQCCFTPDP